MKAVKVFLLITALVLLFGMLPGQADAAGVVSVSVHSTGHTSVSTDIIRFNFEGKITTNGPTTVHYRWIRSDGAIAPVQTLMFLFSGTKEVNSYWQLGQQNHPVHLWKAIEIVSPNAMTSNHANITVPPKSGHVTHVHAISTGHTNVAPHTMRFTFEGKIATNGPATVKYRWIRSDGAVAPVHTLVFAGAETKEVTTYWQLGQQNHPVHLWQAVEIESPNAMTSNHANITVPPL